MQQWCSVGTTKTAVTVLPPAHPKVVAAVKPEQWSALGAAQLEAGALAEGLKVVGEKTGLRHRSLPMCVEAYGASAQHSG